MRYVQVVLFLIFLGALLIFAVQNQQSVSIRFLNWGVTAPLALQAVAIYLLGMLSGWTVVAFVRRSLQRVGERQV